MGGTNDDINDFSIKEKIGYVLFLLGATSCFGTSSLYHLLKCYRPEVVRRALIMDYNGIFLMITGSYYSGLESMYGDNLLPYWKVGYQIFFCGGSITLVILRTLFGDFMNRSAWLRNFVFATLIVGGLAPVLHGGFLYGFEFAPPYLISLCCYFVGFIFFLSKFPEAYFRATYFDYFGASHQIWHVCVSAAAFTHYLALPE